MVQMPLFLLLQFVVSQLALPVRVNLWHVNLWYPLCTWEIRAILFVLTLLRIFRNSSHLFTKEILGIQLLTNYYVLLMPNVLVTVTHSKILNVRLSLSDIEPVEVIQCRNYFNCYQNCLKLLFHRYLIYSWVFAELERIKF